MFPSRINAVASASEAGVAHLNDAGKAADVMMQLLMKGGSPEPVILYLAKCFMRADAAARVQPGTAPRAEKTAAAAAQARLTISTLVATALREPGLFQPGHEDEYVWWLLAPAPLAALSSLVNCTDTLPSCLQPLC